MAFGPQGRGPWSMDPLDLVVPWHLHDLLLGNPSEAEVLQSSVGAATILSMIRSYISCLEIWYHIISISDTPQHDIGHCLGHPPCFYINLEHAFKQWYW